MFASITSTRLIKFMCFSAVLFFSVSCKKTNAPNGGSFNYTVTDTNNVVHNFSDFSNLIGGLYYYNNGGAGSSQFPAGYISNHAGVHYFLFYYYTTPATNNITFSVPAYNQSISGDTSSTTSSLVINLYSSYKWIELSDASFLIQSLRRLQIRPAPS